MSHASRRRLHILGRHIEINKELVEKIMKTMENTRASGPQKIPVEFQKNLNGIPIHKICKSLAGKEDG